MSGSAEAGQPLTITANASLVDGVSLVVPFDNTLSLWRDRTLIARASPLVVIGVTTNRFAARTLTDVLRLVPTGRVVCLLEDHCSTVDADALMSLIETIAPGEFQRLPNAETSGHEALMITRAAPPPPWWTAQHTGWSMVFPDGESAELPAQLATAHEMARRAGVTCELLVASTRPVDVPHADVRVVLLPRTDATLAMRLNRLAESASHADLLYLRAGHTPASDFFSGMATWGYGYAIATPRLQDPHGARGADWLLLAGDASAHAPTALLDYRAHSPFATIGGGALLLRRPVWQRHRWNENLRGEGVVLEYVRRLQRIGCLPLAADAVIHTSAVSAELPQLPFDAACDIALAPHSGPWRVAWRSTDAPWMAPSG